MHAWTTSQLEGPLRNLWFPTPDWATAYETGFIVIGPIPNDNPGHLTTGVASTSDVACGYISHLHVHPLYTLSLVCTM
jgi:hypothetical protein